MRFGAASIVFIFLVAPLSSRATYPAKNNELVVGLGHAGVLESSAFNTPDDLEPSPEAAFWLAYRRRLDDRWAWGLHLYGTGEEVRGLSLTGSDNATPDYLITSHFGGHVMLRFGRGRLRPYLLAGGGLATGAAEFERRDDLTYTGISALVGGGFRWRATRRFAVSTTATYTVGDADWEKSELVPADRREFDPSMFAASIDFSLLWGDPAPLGTRASRPEPDDVAVGPPPGIAAARTDGSPGKTALTILLIEGLSVFNSGVGSTQGGAAFLGGFYTVGILYYWDDARQESGSTAIAAAKLSPFAALAALNFALAGKDMSESARFNTNFIGHNVGLLVEWLFLNSLGQGGETDSGVAIRPEFRGGPHGGELALALDW